MTANTQEKRHGVYALAILVLVLGAVTFYLGSGSFAIQTLGLAALLVSLYLVRLSNVHARPASALAARQAAANRPGRLIWIISLALIPALGLSFFLLYEDSRHGSHQTWPLYLFAGIALICVGFWSALGAKLWQ